MPIVAASSLVVIALISNAAGYPYRPTIGPVALAATWTLGCGSMVFVLALNAVWSDNAGPTAEVRLGSCVTKLAGSKGCAQLYRR
jgi:hypothetical protein